MYNNRLRRTGSTPAALFPSSSSSSNPLDTDDSHSDTRQARGAPWSGLWGLAGWIDQAIHPGSRSRSRKNSDSEISSLRPTRRVPSLDDLLLSSTAPRRDLARRTASSGSGHAYSRRDAASSTDESDSELKRSRSSRRQSRFSQSASLILTSTNREAAEAAEATKKSQAWPTQHENLQDPEMMTEKERQDVVEFDRGDFAPEHVDRPRERTISQGSEPSSCAEGSSAGSHHANTITSTLNPDARSADLTQDKQHQPMQTEREHLTLSQDEADEKSVDSETLLQAAKGEPKAIEAVAQEDPSSAVIDPAASSASLTPRKESPAAPAYEADTTAGEGQDTPKGHRNGLKQSDSCTSAFTTPSASRRSSLRRKNVDSLASSSSSSLVSTDSDKAIDRSLTPRRRKSGRSSASAKESETDESKSHHPPPSKSGQTRRKGSSAKRAIRRTLVAIRDLLLAVLLCPVNCVRYLQRRRVISAQEAVEAIYNDSAPILEKHPSSSSLSNEQVGVRNGKVVPSLGFSDSNFDEKQSIADIGRPKTRIPNEPNPTMFDKEEPVTEDQAAASGIVWKSLSPSSPGQRTRSRLLPNPQIVDPMLAHNRKAQPIDVAAAEKEAIMEAERQSRIAKGRAARAAAKAGISPSSSSPSPSPSPSTLIPCKVPRGPVASSIIHHSPKILVLDLDETLIHSTSRSPTHNVGGGRTTTSGFLGLETAGAVLGLRANDNPRRIRPHMVEVVLDGRSVLYHVYKRPWVDYFLRKVSSWYTVVIFTASVQEYADPVIDWLDQGRGFISARLFRESCSFKGGSYVKNLKVVDQDLSKVCLVDNSPASYRLQRENGIPIEGWTNDPNDEALLDLLPVLDSLRFAGDVRHVLGIRGW